MNKDQRYVRILKDGFSEGLNYKKGEIYEVAGWYTKNKLIILKEKNAEVSVFQSNQYGKEAEFISDEEALRILNKDVKIKDLYGI